MAKIRTVKPELFRHEALYEIEIETKLPLRIAFVGLFTCCDREGRFRWRPKQLKLDILPYDTIEMEAVLEALMRSGFIVRYTIQGENYGYIPSWNKHQYINHRESASALPAPEIRKPVAYISDFAISEEPRVTDESEKCTGLLKGKRKGNGKEMEVEMEQEIYSTRAVIANDVMVVFNHWKTTLQHPQALLDKKREQVIQRALDSGYSVVQLCEAITGCSKTPHNMGDNDRNQRYDGIHLILRDADQIERFIRNSHQPPLSSQTKDKLLRANLTSGENWLNKKLAEINADDTC